MAAGLAEAGTINLYSGPLTFLPFRLGRAVSAEPVVLVHLW